MIKLFAIFSFFIILTADVIMVDNPSVWIKKAEKISEKHFKQAIYFESIDLDNNQINTTNSFYYSIKNENRDVLGIAVISKANGCVVGGCSISNINETRYETFYLLSIYDRNKSLIQLSVLDYAGEYGYEISAKWWLRQFLEKPSKKYIYRQNIDAISGATVSAQSVVNEINALNSFINKLNFD